MKTFMTTLEATLALASVLPDLAPFMKNGHINSEDEKCIGIFIGSNSRRFSELNLGGLETTEIGFLPINITFHWTEDYDQCQTLATSVQMLLYQQLNLVCEKRKIACFLVIDGGPQDLGRTDKNICEMVLRVDVIYYLEEVVIND